MNAIAKVESQLGLSIKDYNIDEAMWSALTSSIFPGAKPESIIMAVEYAKARSLDIMKKPCHIVPMSVKNAQTGNTEWRDTIMPSITEHRITAHRTGQYAGQDEPIFGPMVQMQFGNKTHTVPEYCTVVVHKIVNGVLTKWSHTEYFEEACATTKDGSLNAMWTKRKRGQLSKCAEAGALRKAFSEELGNEYTAEEMHGKTLDVTGTEAVPENFSSPSDSIPEGYQAFEDEHLPFFKQEAQYGTKRLAEAHATLPKNTWSAHFWSTHSISLKEIAQFADQALQRQGETYEHSPA
jgi:phage recombination protein Bet